MVDLDENETAEAVGECVGRGTLVGSMALVFVKDVLVYVWSSSLWSLNSWDREVRGVEEREMPLYR